MKKFLIFILSFVFYCGFTHSFKSNVVLVLEQYELDGKGTRFAVVQGVSGDSFLSSIMGDGQTFSFDLYNDVVCGNVDIASFKSNTDTSFASFIYGQSTYVLGGALQSNFHLKEVHFKANSSELCRELILTSL